MGIRIDEINIKNLGPIANLQWKLATINLVYGKNESGKTHLVEFLIQSLFKNVSYPGIRKLQGVGQISVQGLEDALVLFSPASKMKMEEYLKRDHKTIPTNISRLMVVRAGELSLVDNRQVGIDRSVLEEYLSNSGLINSIRDRIPPTVQKSSVVDGIILGNHQGLVKDLYTRKDEQKALDELITQVNVDYSTGYRAWLQVKYNEAQNAFSAEKQAKCHLAYTLSQNIQQLEQELETISDEVLGHSEHDLAEYRSKTESHKKLEDSHQAKVAGSTELPWLKAALEDYQTLATGKAQATKIWPLLLAGLFLAGAGFFILIRQPYLAVCMLLIGSGLGYFYVHNLRQSALLAIQNTEINRIATEFKQKFGRELTDLSSLRRDYEAQNEAGIAARTIVGQMNDLQVELTACEQAISDNLFKLTLERLPKEAWGDQMQKISQRVRDLKEQIDDDRLKFTALQVEAVDFRSEPSSQDYDDARYKELEQKVEDLGNKLKSEDERLNSLRQRLAQETRLDISTSWEKLIEKLQEKRLNVNKEYQDITAKILADIVVNSALNDLYKEEEQSIQEGLRSCQVTDYLKKITSHYNRIEFDNGLLKVADPFTEYNFGDLSTATQEQVLLALRLGFSSRSFFDQSMFMVLDDAFQHSDWERRDYLIDSMLEIARLGWQVIYLTMDNNIRDLFRTKAEVFAPNEYRDFEL